MGKNRIEFAQHMAMLFQAYASNSLKVLQVLDLLLAINRPYLRDQSKIDHADTSSITGNL